MKDNIYKMLSTQSSIKNLNTSVPEVHLLEVVQQKLMLCRLFQKSTPVVC